MREKLADIYGKLLSRKEEIDKEMTGKMLPGWESLIGKKLYRCMSSYRNPTSELEEWTVYDIGIVAKDNRELSDYLGHYGIPTGKITKKLVEEAKEYVDKYESVPLEMFEILFLIEGRLGGSRVTTGERYKPGVGFKDEKISFHPADFNEKIEADQIEYDKNYRPREGYVACERCGKQVPEKDVVRYKLIYRGSMYGRQMVMNRMGTFCSGQCAMDEQMSLEG